MLQSTSLLRGKTLLQIISRTFPMLQSTSLLRGKTSVHIGKLADKRASIHFPLAREDYFLTGQKSFLACFNPLPSCEGRRTQLGGFYQGEVLQSTSLLRGKTKGSGILGVTDTLQSTSLLRGKTVPVGCCFKSTNASIHFPLAREDNQSRF